MKKRKKKLNIEFIITLLILIYSIMLALLIYLNVFR